MKTTGDAPNAQPTQRSQLFTVRLWLEDRGAGRVAWRGKVQHVPSGDACYIRNWDTLTAFLSARLSAGKEMQMDMQGAERLAVNRAVVRAWIAARNANDLEAALPLIAEDRRDAVRKGFAAFSAAFPDIHITEEDLIAEGDKVVLHFTLRGTHLGTWAGIPPTGKKVAVPVIHIYTLKDGKLAAVTPLMPDLKARLME